MERAVHQLQRRPALAVREPDRKDESAQGLIAFYDNSGLGRRRFVALIQL
jgi:hypothetical protein